MEELRENVAKYVSVVANWFISTAVIMWGWNTLAPHINCPTFGYWEMFAMRMGFSYFISIITNNFAKSIGGIEND
jgi:hypothetical protein